MKRNAWRVDAAVQDQTDSVTACNGSTVQARRSVRQRPPGLAMVAHEVCGSAVPLRLQLDLLRSGRLGRLDPRQEQALKVAERSLDRLTGLLQDLSDLSRIDGDGIHLDRKTTDLNGLVREVRAAFAGLADKGGITLECDLQQAVWFQADPARLMQVLTNLVSNAIKFTPSGGRITLSTRLDGEEVEIVVSDTGRGLDPERIDELFQSFSQVHDPQEDPAGIGLGLYISQGIIRQHGGEIKATSQGLGKGSTFVVILPLVSSVRLERVPEVKRKWNRCG